MSDLSKKMNYRSTPTIHIKKCLSVIGHVMHYIQLRYLIKQLRQAMKHESIKI